MKRAIIICALLINSLVTAQDTTTTDPKELTSLRESWTRARNLATAPIDKKYLDALAAMKVKLTRSGDLNGALAVEAEIKANSPTADATAISEAEAELINTKRELESHLLGKKWKMTQLSSGASWGIWEFMANGTIKVNQPRKWSIKDKRTVIIENYEAEFSEDLTSFIVVWGGTGELKGVVHVP